MKIKNSTNKIVSCDSPVQIISGSVAGGQPPFTVNPRQMFVITINSQRTDNNDDSIVGNLTNCSVHPHSGPPLGADKRYIFTIVYDERGIKKDVSNNDGVYLLGETQNNRYYSKYSPIYIHPNAQNFSAEIEFTQGPNPRAARMLEEVMHMVGLY